MASVVDKFKKRGKSSGSSSSEWSRTGSFLHKPDRGWIHPDEQLATDAGICYGVRYIGCLEVKESMRALDFDTRTALAREAINRVSEAAGLKTANKRKKVEKRIGKMLSDTPMMQFAGSNVNLTITVDSINLMVMESGEVIANHLMPGISFASGGDALKIPASWVPVPVMLCDMQYNRDRNPGKDIPETLDFVAYVAKDEMAGRACHVLECGGGLSEDVITTIGQAFELRFKEYLKKQPKPMRVPDRLEQSYQDGDAWGENDEDNEYYNDNPNAQPPSPQQSRISVPSEYSYPPSNLPVSDGVYSSVKEDSSNTFVYDTPKDLQLIDFSDTNGTATYDNPTDKNSNVDDLLELDTQQPGLYDNPKLKKHGQSTTNGSLDPFDMQPFNASLSNGHTDKTPTDDQNGATGGEQPASTGQQKNTPLFEEWFHGNLTRKEAEKLLIQDGDFLVRQSSADTNQYVLSGRQHGLVKHLLLVDPAGVVRTKDHTFESVPHLISFHRTQDIPIVSQESELHLKRPISNKLSFI